MTDSNYEKDLKAFMDADFELNAIVGPDTVLIVTGFSMMSELFDRPLAQKLRDAINQHNDADTTHRAVIIGDGLWDFDASLQKNPFISIGDISANSLTYKIFTTSAHKEEEGRHTLISHENPSQIALWGDDELFSKQCIELFIKKELKAFLEKCWTH